LVNSCGRFNLKILDFDKLKLGKNLFSKIFFANKYLKKLNKKGREILISLPFLKLLKSWKF
jgi:hypothetical protein